MPVHIRKRYAEGGPRPTAVSTSGSPELSVRPYRNASPWECHARGLGTGAASGPFPGARHPARSLGLDHCAPLPERSQGMKTRLNVKEDS